MNLENLFNKAKSGDKGAEKALFSRLLVRFRLIAYHILKDKELAEDAAQEAIINVLRTYCDLEVHTSFVSWAQTIIRRQALKFIEKQKREQRAAIEIGKRINVEFQKTDSNSLEKKILDCLEKISKEERKFARVLNLKHLGYTFEEICEKMNLSKNYVYVLLHRARKALSNCLGGGYDKK